ncbi:DNA repair protein RecN [Chloroflexota bacterium]
MQKIGIKRYNTPVSSNQGVELLLEFKVRNFGIIEAIDLKLNSGFNVITGETGVGKSLVADAIETLLSGRLDEEDIRHEANVTQLEGVFTLPANESRLIIKETLARNGLDSDEEILVITCEFRRQGRGVFRVNRNAVPRNLLQEIGSLLVDIHGQSDHLSLLNREYQLIFLDSYAHSTALRQGFHTKATELNQIDQEIKMLEQRDIEAARQDEFLRFQIDEIKRSELREGEDEELEKQRNILMSCEKLKKSSYQAYKSLYGDESSVSPTSALDKLNEAISEMRKLVELDTTLGDQLKYLENTVENIQEIARDIHSYSDSLEYDPAQLEAVELRLESIRNLKRKYGQTIADIINHSEKLEQQLEEVSQSSEKLVRLEERHNELKKEMGQLAFELSETRRNAAKKLETEVSRGLRDLNMSQVEYQVSIRKQPAEEGIPLPDGKTYTFNKDGVDDVEFVASTNPGEPIKPLAKIASTGEISRFMLALKGALAEADTIPVLIFDEIDIGVGGRSGEIIGKKLFALSRNRQVLCVTHLPQIAAFADTHYNVRKVTSDSRMVSTLERLDGGPRIEEIAVMLSGPHYTETTLNNARELLEKASIWKKT